MKSKNLAGFAFLACLACTPPALAQSGSWETSFTYYVFAAETDTSISTARGTIESTLSFSDALENLDFAFMGALEARNGPWSLIGDFAQTDLSFSNSTPGPAFGGVDADTKLQVLNVYALYETHKDTRWTLDLGAGVRWFNTDNTITLLPGLSTGRSSRFDQSWIDPVLAARLTFAITDRWTGSAFVDYGGFRSNSESFQVALTARYAFNNNWSFVAGYRYLDLAHGPANDEFGFSQSGPVLGVRYDF